MDKRKIANQKVKDKLLSALMTLIQEKEISKITVTELIETSGVARASFYRNFKSVEEILTYGLEQMSLEYHKGRPSTAEDFNDKALIEYKFRFYKEHGKIVLAFHRSKASLSLLDVISDCVIDSHGDMPTSSISKYSLYYYSGAFYNMVLHWLENGAKESVEDMAEEFLRISDKKLI